MRNLLMFLFSGLLLFNYCDSGTNHKDSDPDKTYSVSYNIILYGGTTDSVGFEYKMKDYDGLLQTGSYLLSAPYLPENPLNWGLGWGTGYFKSGDSLYFEADFTAYCSNLPCSWNGRCVIKVDDEEYLQKSFNQNSLDPVILQGILSNN